MHHVYLVFNANGKFGGVFKSVGAIVAYFKKCDVPVNIGRVEGKRCPIFSGEMLIGHIHREKVHS